MPPVVGRAMPAAERKTQPGTKRPRVSTYLTVEENEVLDAAAERMGVSRSAMLRTLCRNAMLLTVGLLPLGELSEAGQALVE